MQYNHFPEQASHKYYFTDYMFLIYSKLQGETLIDTHHKHMNFSNNEKKDHFHMKCLNISVILGQILKVLGGHHIFYQYLYYVQYENVTKYNGQHVLFYLNWVQCS